MKIIDKRDKDVQREWVVGDFIKRTNRWGEPIINRISSLDGKEFFLVDQEDGVSHVRKFRHIRDLMHYYKTEEGTSVELITDEVTLVIE